LRDQMLWRRGLQGGSLSLCSGFSSQYQPQTAWCRKAKGRREICSYLGEFGPITTAGMCRIILERRETENVNLNSTYKFLSNLWMDLEWYKGRVDSKEPSLGKNNITCIWAASYFWRDRPCTLGSADLKGKSIFFEEH
jgi:hypothetical protein